MYFFNVKKGAGGGDGLDVWGGDESGSDVAVVVTLH